MEVPRSNEKWWLVTQLPPTKVGTKNDLEILRQVDPEELRHTREANGLLNRLASAAPYARLVELFQELEEALTRGSTPKRTAADMNRAVRALGLVAGVFPDELRRHAAGDLAAEKLVEIEVAISEECGRSPFCVLAAVGTLASGPFSVVADGVATDRVAIAALSAQVPEVTPAIDLIATLRTGVLVAQRLLGRLLEIYVERIDEESSYLRHLGAEAPDGAPALMRADNLDPASGKLEIGEMTFEPLALDKAVYLHRARRLAQSLLRATDEAAIAQNGVGTATSPSGTPDVVDSEEVAPESVVAPANDLPDGSSLLPSTDGEDALPDPETAAAEPPPGTREDQVVDLRALAAHASELTDELEHAWSEGLEPTALGEAHTELNARLGSLVYSIQRRVAAADRALRDAGIDPTIPAFPLPASELEALTFEPDPERRWRQLQMAEIESLMALLGAFQAMRAPSAHRVTVATGEVESWWEAGAFNLLRARVRLLVRVSEAASAAETVVMREDAPDEQAHDFLDQLRLAGEALANGDPEGALVHSLIALRERAALATDSVPDDLLDRVAADSRLGADAPVLRLLYGATTKLGAGETLDVGAAVLVAPRAVSLIGQLCLQMPEILLAALGEAGNGN